MKAQRARMLGRLVIGLGALSMGCGEDDLTGDQGTGGSAGAAGSTAASGGTGGTLTTGGGGAGGTGAAGGAGGSAGAGGTAATGGGGANGRVYYLRADGTATNAVDAAGHPEYEDDVSKCLNVASHNAQTFSPGDLIYLSDKGGVYTPSGPEHSVLVPPSDGVSGSPIVYAKVPGETPTINMLFDITDGGGGGWDVVRPGVYTSHGRTIGRAMWEDGVALKQATSNANVGVDGDWYYQNGSGKIVYAPTSGVPSDHTLGAIFYDGALVPSVVAIELRERSFIDLSGLVIDYGMVGIGQKTDSAATILDGIRVHDCTFNYSPWAIVGAVYLNDCVFQNAEFYGNTINYSNCGISVWTASITTPHTARPQNVNIHDNAINHLFSVDASHDWNYATKQNPDDHEGISFQDPVGCTIYNNTITKDLPLDTAARAIFIYTNPNAVSPDNNVISHNRITGGFDRTINFSGGGTSGQGNVISCNVVKNPLTSASTENYLIFIGNSTPNTTPGMNYVSNNTLYSAYSAGSGIHLGNNDGKWTAANNIIDVNHYNMVACATTPSDFVISNNNYFLGGFHNCSQSVNWNTWQSYGWDVSGSYYNVNPQLDANLAITSLSPDGVKTGGTPIDGITYSGSSGLPGIDGRLYDLTNPAMGAYAQPE